MGELLPIPDGPLRHGYTTGACATAATKAALLALLLQQKVLEVEISLPHGEQVIFKMNSCEFTPDWAACTTIKDAGDDPDVTHGAVIGSKVQLNKEKKIRFLQGEGVGVVTLPGLSIPVGEPAINPVPRQMMTSVVNKLLFDYQVNAGVDIAIFVNDGEAIARKTLNARLGILGGISILGTTGIVKPFSAASYIASIEQGIDVAIANGSKEIAINSGARSEKVMRELFPDLPEFAFIHYGNWIGETLNKISQSNLAKVNIGIMLGKAVKLAKGEMDTHSGKTSWDKNFIIQMAINAGYDERKCQQIEDLNMARRLTELFDFQPEEAFYQHLAAKCYASCKSIIENTDLDVYLISDSGNIIYYQK